MCRGFSQTQLDHSGYYLGSCFVCKKNKKKQTSMFDTLGLCPKVEAQSPVSTNKPSPTTGNYKLIRDFIQEAHSDCSIFGHRACSRISAQAVSLFHTPALGRASLYQIRVMLAPAHPRRAANIGGLSVCDVFTHAGKCGAPDNLGGWPRCLGVRLRRLHTAVKDISSTWLSGCDREHPEGGRRHMDRLYLYLLYIYLEREHSVFNLKLQ